MDQNKKEPSIQTHLSDFSAYCGLEVLEKDEEHCVVRVELRPELHNPAGNAHGGLIATLTDVAAGYVAILADHDRRWITTQSADIHYLRAGRGAYLQAESHLIRKGNRVCVVGVDVESDDGSLAATAIYEICYLREVERPFSGA